jgi:hypothetical protein
LSRLEAAADDVLRININLAAVSVAASPKI